MKGGNLSKNIMISAASLMFAACLFYVPADAGSAGSSSASFLQFTPSPRASGMGESYVSVAEDAYAGYWNPAGLASVELPEFVATYNASFEDVTHQYMSLAYPLRYGSSVGLNITRLTVAPFQGYDAAGFKTKKVDSADTAVGGAYARTLMKDEIERPVLNVGGNLKFISEKLDNASAGSVAADVGALYYIRPGSSWLKNAPGQEFRIGIAVRNIGPGLKFDKTSFPLPMSLTLGSSWLNHPSGNSSLIFSLDQTLLKDGGYNASFGAEFTAFQLLAFRLGYKTGQDIGSGVRFGVGFRLSLMDLDYSMSPFGELGTMHKFGVSMRFGNASARHPLEGATQRVKNAALIAPKEKIEELHIFANDFLSLARQNLSERRYTSALENIGKAFNLEPGLKAGEWGEKFKRLSALNKNLGLKDIPEREKVLQNDNEQSGLACEAIAAYLDGYDLKAFLLSHAALGANVGGDALFEELLNVMSNLTRMGVRRDEILPKGVLVSEKLKKSIKAFYQRKFDTAAKECKEAILLDESNYLAWTRLGSAYYMMGDKDGAKKAYMKVMELNPDDKVTRDFINSQGWK